MRISKVIMLLSLMVVLSSCSLWKNNNIASELKNNYCNDKNETKMSEKEELMYQDSSLNKVNVKDYQTSYEKGNIKCLENNDNTVVVDYTNKNKYVMGVFVAIKEKENIDNTVKTLNQLFSKTSLKITNSDLQTLIKDKQLEKLEKYMLYLDEYSDGYIITVN